MSELLRKAETLAPALPEPPKTGPVADAARSRQMMLWMLAAFFGVVILSSLSGPGGGLFLLAALAFGGIAFYTFRERITEWRKRNEAPMVREAVVVIDKRQEGRRQTSHYIVVENAKGERRELEVIYQPGVVAKGDVGVVFSRGNLLWSFHRVD